MSLYTLMTHTMNTYRLTATSGIKKEYTANLINQQCLIQPISPEFAAKTGLVFDRTYNCFVPLGTDLQIGDKTIDQDGKEYRVTGSLKRNYGVYTPHLTFLLSEETGATPNQ